MKEFITAVKAEGREVADPVTVSIDEREVTFRPPREKTLAMLIAAVSGGTTTMRAMSDIINTFMELLDDDDESYFRRRLFDYDDPFEVEDMTEILLYLVEEWSGRPTKQPSDYLPSQKSGGRKSTARRRQPVLTPSD